MRIGRYAPGKHLVCARIYTEKLLREQGIAPVKFICLIRTQNKTKRVSYRINKCTNIECLFIP